VSRPRSQSYLRQPLNELLGTPAAVRVLRELSLKGSAVATVQLARDTLMTLAAVRNSLAQLSVTGLVESFGARAGVYALNEDHPLASVLQRLFHEERAWWQGILSQLSESLQSDERIVAGYLYGSVARQEDIPRSDVDILLVTSGAPDAVLEDFRSRVQELERHSFVALSIVGISRKEARQKAAANDSWWMNVLKDAVPLKGPRAEHLSSKR
jgi:predicted nucleotidyltransferase